MSAWGYEYADTRQTLRLERERRQDRDAQRLRARFLPRPDEGVLDQPEHQALIRRLGESVDSSFPERIEHVRAIALDVIAARARPRHPVNGAFGVAK